MLINTVQKSSISKEILSCGKLLKACEFLISDLSTNEILKEIFSNINFPDINLDSNKLKEKISDNNRHSFNLEHYDNRKELKYYLS